MLYNRFPFLLSVMTAVVQPVLQQAQAFGPVIGRAVEVV
jgi:hypothetical protein